VGKKTAARLLIELKSRLDLPQGDPSAALAAVGGTGEPVPASARADVRDALAGLGYSVDEIAEATRELPDADPGAMLREALRRLATAR
jgi:Holliday junction DNA helicase RuvA